MARKQRARESLRVFIRQASTLAEIYSPVDRKTHGDAFTRGGFICLRRAPKPRDVEKGLGVEQERRDGITRCRTDNTLPSAPSFVYGAPLQSPRRAAIARIYATLF